MSETADVRLVKGCAGINFMLMSFMAYAWAVRPQRCVVTGLLSWIALRLLYLTAAIFAAWATGLIANSLRIIDRIHANLQLRLITFPALRAYFNLVRLCFDRKY